jgi:chromosome segregation ATPase
VDELERAADAAAKRRAETLTAWESQRRDLAKQLETLREARRASEEEISAVRAKSREAASNYQETIDGLQSELADETRRRAESENAAATARREVESTRSGCDDLNAELDRLRENVRSKDARHETKIDGLRAELESARHQNRALQDRIDEVTSEYERLLRSEPAQNPVNDELAARVAELEEQLAEARAARSRAEARFVGAENRAAFAEMDDVGYRSQFSSIAREFFEREVARQTDSQNGGDQANGQESAESILDAVERMRR